MKKRVRKPRWLQAYVFTTGAVVMMLEMAAFRLLTPVFGSSVIVWGAIISVVMIALAMGYHIGGVVADKSPKNNTLFAIGAGAAIYTALIPLVLTPLLESVSLHDILAGTNTAKVIISSFFAAAFIFSPSIFILGMVSPLAIRLATKDISTVGQTAGGLYAASTTGSIIGTFFASFLLIPFVGTTETIFISSGILIVASIWGYMPNVKTLAVFIIPLLAYGIFLSMPQDEFFYQTDSLYSDIRLEEVHGGTLQLKMNAGLGVHSIYNPNSHWSNAYWDYMATVPSLLGAEEVTILGVAGGTIPRVMEHIDPSIHVTGIEIDPELTEIATQFFGSSLNNVDVVHDDGRRYIAQHPGEADLLIMDAYGRDAYIPFHLATVEFFEDAKNHVGDDGVVALNLASGREGTALFQAVMSTAQSVFKEVNIISLDGSANHIILAADHPIELSDTFTIDEKRGEDVLAYMRSSYQPAPETDGWILTDNRSPIEFLTDSIIFQVL